MTKQALLFICIQMEEVIRGTMHAYMTSERRDINKTNQLILPFRHTAYVGSNKYSDLGIIARDDSS